MRFWEIRNSAGATVCWMLADSAKRALSLLRCGPGIVVEVERETAPDLVECAERREWREGVLRFAEAAA